MGGARAFSLPMLSRRSLTLSGATAARPQPTARRRRSRRRWRSLPTAGRRCRVEASGSPKAYDGIFDHVRPGGCLVLIDMPIDPAAFDVVAAGVKEAQIVTVF